MDFVNLIILKLNNVSGLGHDEIVFSVLITPGDLCLSP